MVTKAALQQKNDELHQRIAELENQLAACKNEKNKDRFRSLFEHAPVAYQSLDEQGNFLDVNPVYCELTGYSEEELLGRNFGDLWTPATCSLFAQAFDTLKRENYIQADLQLACKDGNVREVVLNGGVQRDEQGQFIRTHCILHDVTDRKHAENAIHESEERFVTLFHANPTAVGITRQPGLEIMEVNDAWCELTGYTRGQAVGHTSTELGLATPETLHRIREELGAHNMIRDLEILLTTHSGKELRVLMSAEPIHLGGETCVLSSLLDITERKQAEEKLRESEERHRLIAELISDYVYILRVEPGNQFVPEWISGSFERFSGYSTAEVQAMGGPMALVPPESKAAFLADSARTLQGETVVTEVQMIVKSGETRWARAYSRPIWDEGHTRIVRIIGAGQDITERRQAEEKLRRSETLLRQVLESTQDAVFAIDREYRLLVNNEAHQQELVATGGHLFEVGENILSPDYPPKVLADWRAVYDRAFQGEASRVESAWIDIEGQPRVYVNEISPLRDADGTITGAMIVAHDITERKQAEKKLSESEQFLKESQRIAKMGSWRLDLSTNKADWSENCCNLYGFEPNEIEPTFKVFKQAVHPDDLHLVEEAFIDIIQNRHTANQELRIFDKYGRMKWVYNSMTPIVEGDQVVQLVGVQIDITERKQAEEQVRIKDRLLQMTSAMANVGGWEFDTRTKEGTWTDEVARIHGLDPAQATSVALGLSFYLEESRAMIEKAIEEAITEGKPYDLTLELVDATGVKKWVHTMGMPVFEQERVVKVQGIFQDITERKQAEQSLKQQTENLQALREASQRLSSTLDLNTIYELVNDFMGEIAPNNGFMISNFDPQSRLITCRAYKLDQEWQDVDEFPPIPLEGEGRGTQSRVIHTGKPMLLNDYRAYQKTASTRYIYDSETGELANITEDTSEEEQQELPGSALVVPLKTGGAVTGVLQLFSNLQNAYTEDQLNLLEALAVHIASAEQNARLYAQAQAELDERKRTEEKLRASEEKYRGLMESLDSLITSVDFDGTILYMNDPAVHQLGGNAETLIGKAMYDVFPPEYAAGEMDIIRQAICENRALIRETQNFVQGKPRWYHIAYQPIHNEKGDVTQVLVNATDIDDIKSAQQELAELNRTLEERIQRATAEIQDLYDNAPAGYHSLDAKGCFLQINQTALNWLGHTREEVIGHPLGEFITPDSLSLFQTKFPIFKQRGWLNDLELEFLRKDGTAFQALVNAAAIYDADGNYLMSRSTVFDNTERKQAEQVLRDSEERYRTLIEYSPMAIAGFDREARLTIINRKAIELLGGTSFEDFAGKPILEFVHPDYRALTLERMRAVTNNEGGAPAIETVYVKLNGQDIHVVSSGVSMKFQDKTIYIVSFFDNTERKRAEAALRENLKRVRALHTISQEAISTTELKSLLSLVADTLVETLSADRVNIMFMDVPNRKIEFACMSGPGASNIVEVSFEEAWEGLSGWVLREKELAWSSGESPDRRESPAVQGRRKATQAGDIIVAPILYQDHPLGTITIINKPEDKPFRAEDLNLVQAIANQSAVAIERVRAGNDLRQVNLALEHALRAKDDFLANMSHELRTPLNGILGMAEILLTGYRGPLNERQRTYVTTIEASGRHLLSLINDVLDLSKIEADKMELHLEEVSADDLCQASLAFIKETAAEKGIQVEFTKDKTVTSIQADARRLKQILVNLLSNAVKFTPAEGRVRLEVRADRARGRIDLSVTDTGIGISAEDQQRIFSPFVQADNSLTRSYEGTGLGLTLVKRLTELHGGSVSVESEAGKGSRFTVSLPWQEPEPTSQAPLEAEAPPTEKAGALADRKSIATILLVEDNPTNVMVIGEYLDSKGYSMVYAADGYEALEKAVECSPDLILMDIQMPGMDGLEATRRLRADPQFAAKPIIALTAYAMKGDRERCLEAGATDYLSKPVKLAELAALIRQLLM
ncbi:MAG: PAS domain S-box protein [Chloroflexi bacterium]|nr:PAS domain S-box protein [Chloroflexota bacterium]